MLGTAGGLSLVLYLPVFLVYFLAKAMGARAPLWAIAVAPLVGVSAMAVA